MGNDQSCGTGMGNKDVNKDANKKSSDQGINKDKSQADRTSR